MMVREVFMCTMLVHRPGGGPVICLSGQGFTPKNPWHNSCFLDSRPFVAGRFSGGRGQERYLPNFLDHEEIHAWLP
jgi:hypothetical protein